MFKYKLTLCPPRLLTTQVKWADLPAAAVIFSKGETKPGSKPVTEMKKKNIFTMHLRFIEVCGNSPVPQSQNVF